MTERPKRPKRPKSRISLNEIDGDWVTVRELAAWSGLSDNAAYELCRQDPLRQHVVHFGRQIRLPKKALVRLMDGAS
jgi:hypothetical protein